MCRLDDYVDECFAENIKHLLNKIKNSRAEHTHDEKNLFAEKRENVHVKLI